MSPAHPVIWCIRDSVWKLPVRFTDRQMEVKREKLDEVPKTRLATLSLSERASETHVSSGFGVGLFEKTTALQNTYI